MRIFVKASKKHRYKFGLVFESNVSEIPFELADTSNYGSSNRLFFLTYLYILLQENILQQPKSVLGNFAYFYRLLIIF